MRKYNKKIRNKTELKSFAIFLSFSEGSNVMSTEEATFDRGYVKKKLEHGLTRIWQVWLFMLIVTEAVLWDAHGTVGLVV